MRKVICAMLCAALATVVFGEQNQTSQTSQKAKYTYIRNGHGVKLDDGEVRSRKGLSYFVVCYKANPEASIHEVMPVFSELGVRFVKREVIDEHTWGYVFDIVKVAPVTVYDTCTKIVSYTQDGSTQVQPILQFSKPTVFWMPKDSETARKRNPRRK